MHPQDLESRIRLQLVMIEQSMAAARPGLRAKDDYDPMEWNMQHNLGPELSPPEPHDCGDCGRSFSVPARLARHLRTHTGEKPHVCTVCQKSFSVKENLSVHLRTHTQERPYPCSVCRRSFEHSGKLHRHMRIHTGERPHRCGLCSKTFIQSGQLVIHMRTHTGEKPYVCSTCSKGFTCSKQLKVHLRTHTGEKPYSCDICGKSFGYNHVLKLHQVAHFGEKVYKCTLCKTTFSNKKQLESHIKSHEDGLAEMLCSPLMGSESSYNSENSSHSDKENSACLFRPSPPSPSSPRLTPMDAQFMLPSIHSVVPGSAPAIPTLSLRPTAQLTGRGSPVYPVTPSLIRSLLAADREQFGPPAPLPSPVLCKEIYARCLVSPGPRPLSATELSPTSPTMASMDESSLPPRKRRLAYSECYSESSDDCSSQKALSPSPAPASPAPRTSVIVFAAHRT